jgi:LDH2 family malate/lactate/ureidoglycolate dehydrogenase
MTARWNPESLAAWTARLFEACSMPAEQAATAADLLVRSELRGYASHGLTRVPSYVEQLRSGGFNPRPKMTHRAFLGGIVLQADGAMGHVAGPYAIRLGLDALERAASVLIVLDSCGHLGALGIHALLAAEAGAFCIIGQRTPPLLAMAGFSRAAIGHNPIAFGCPAGPGRSPIVFDMACSVAARGHILLAAREGRAIPQGWALDANGDPTTDAEAALGGSLMPIGGHKGLGLAMMVECLAGALSASAGVSDAGRDNVPRAGAAGRQSGFLWMVAPAAFTEAEMFHAYTAQWSETFLGAAGDDGRLPGARGAVLERQGREHGIALPPAIERELSAVGERLGVKLPAIIGKPEPLVALSEV